MKIKKQLQSYTEIKCKTNPNGDGQECPSYMRGGLESPGVVLLEVDLASFFVFGSQPTVLLAVAVGLMMERGFFGFKMCGLARGQLAGFEFGGMMLLTDVFGCGGAVSGLAVRNALWLMLLTRL